MLFLGIDDLFSLQFVIEKRETYSVNINYIFHHIGYVFCSHVLQNKAIMERVTNLSDTVVGLESFIGSERETNPLYKDYHGKFHP